MRRINLTRDSLLPEGETMPCRHIFGDLDSEPLGTTAALPFLTHPKAERLFGQVRAIGSELKPANVEAEERLSAAAQ